MEHVFKNHDFLPENGSSQGHDRALPQGHNLALTLFHVPLGPRLSGRVIVWSLGLMTNARFRAHNQCQVRIDAGLDCHVRAKFVRLSCICQVRSTVIYVPSSLDSGAPVTD